MLKITPILFIPLLLSFLCGCKEKEQQSNQAILEIDPDLEECDSLCGASDEAEDRLLWQKNSLKKIRAIYKDSLNKNAPKCKECDECDIEELIDKIRSCQKRLEFALKIGIPYPTIEEKIEEDEKIKAAFKKRFGTSMADFELSIVGIRYGESSRVIRSSRGRVSSYGGSEFSAIRTESGASGNAVWWNSWKTRGYEEEIADIGMDDWLDFIMALQKWKISKWEESYLNYYNDIQLHPDDSPASWVITIYYLDNEGYIEKFVSSGVDEDRKISKNYPPNFAGFIKAVEKIYAKIRVGMLMKYGEKKWKASESAGD